MKNFIDTVQSVILDIRYENNVLELLVDEMEEDEIKWDNTPMTEEEYQEYLRNELLEEDEAPHRDIYGNIIGAYPILYGPIKTISNIRKI